MTMHYVTRRAALLAMLIAIAGCGGGGGGGGGGAAGGGGGGGAASFPVSGAYAWILKATGPTNALKYGLSLVHPSKTDTEYIIEFASAVVTDAQPVLSGTVDAAQSRATSLQPQALVYIVGGDVRSLPLQADGTAPITRVQRAQSTSACTIVIQANDYASPQNSRYIVSTAGADGQCGTADDGRAEVQLAASGKLGYAPVVGDFPLDVVRDPATLAPRGWIYPRSVVLWNTTPATTIATRSAPAAAISAVIASSPNAALVEDGTQLSVLTFGTGAAVSEANLDATLSAGGSWQSTGFDANNFYAYVNSSGNASTSTWKLLSVTRNNPTATLVASGAGMVAAASMGQNMLYLTVFGASDNKLIRVAKTGGAPVVTSTVTTTLLTVQTSASAVHQRWAVSGVGTATIAYTIDFIDETDATLYNVPGGFPMAIAEADTHNFDASESASRFIVAGNYGSRLFGDAALIGYDSAARSATRLGTLPGTAVFGNNAVYASVIAGPGSFGAGFGAASVNGSLQESGSTVFSYDLGVVDSLKLTTTKQ